MAMEVAEAATTSPIREALFAGREDVSPLLLRRLSDEQLGSRLASGEAAAFDELYRRYVHRLSAYGANLLGDAAVGDDVAQSALLKAYGALRDGRVPDRVKPWLYRIAHNCAIDLVARRRELPFAQVPEGSTGSGEPVEHSGALVEALAALPDRQRSVYVLRELHGLRIDETAAELGLTTTQVEQSLFVARNRLAEHLVFGDRLNCVAVQRLALGPLDRDERRALKTHLRACPPCRSSLGLRGRAIGFVPVATFDWLRGLFAGLATGGAPAAAKVGAVVATATFAAGVPVAVDQASHHPRPFIPVAAAATKQPRHRPVLTAATVQTHVANVSSRPVAVAAVTFVHTTTHRARKRAKHGEDGGSSVPPVIETHDGGGGDDGGDHTAVVPVVALSPSPVTPDGGGDQPTTTTTTEAVQPTSSDDSKDGGGGDGHGSDSGGDGQDSGSGDGSSHN